MQALHQSLGEGVRYPPTISQRFERLDFVCIGAEGLDPRERNGKRHEQQGLKQGHHGVGEEIGDRPQERDAAEGPRHEWRGDRSGDDADGRFGCNF